MLDNFLQHAHALVGRKANDWWDGVLSSGFYGVSEMKWCLKEKNLTVRKFGTKSCMVMVEGFLRRFFYHLSTLAS